MCHTFGMVNDTQREAADTSNHLLTIGQVAKLLGKPVSTIRSWYATGIFVKPVKRQRGLKMQWRRGDVEAWARGASNAN